MLIQPPHFPPLRKEYTLDEAIALCRAREDELKRVGYVQLESGEWVPEDANL